MCKGKLYKANNESEMLSLIIFKPNDVTMICDKLVQFDITDADLINVSDLGEIWDYQLSAMCVTQ